MLFCSLRGRGCFCFHLFRFVFRLFVCSFLCLHRIKPVISLALLKSSIGTRVLFEFSTLYTSLPHTKLELRFDCMNFSKKFITPVQTKTIRSYPAVTSKPSGWITRSLHDIHISFAGNCASQLSTAYLSVLEIR